MKQTVNKPKLNEIRSKITGYQLLDEQKLLDKLSLESSINEQQRLSIQNRSIKLINQVREEDAAILESFLCEYGLSNEEGVALMCLAETLMRVPDDFTLDELLEDKIVHSQWRNHQGKSDSTLVNASTLGLMLTQSILSNQTHANNENSIKKLVKKFGKPVIRKLVKKAIQHMGTHFVLGETIEQAIAKSKKSTLEGYTFSYDMLGEAALTLEDADYFFSAYQHAIDVMAPLSKAESLIDNPSISIKLSALHPRYEVSQKDRLIPELTDKVMALVLKAKKANIGLTIDAEESFRQDLSLDIIQLIFQDDRLENWEGFGVVVQAYNKGAPVIIDWLYHLAQHNHRKISVRLVKGAYWDAEIKRAQIEGTSDYPVYTYKSATDTAYAFCAEKLLAYSDCLHPQFATHNTNSIATILELASKDSCFEFQRLHGMGQTMHNLIHKNEHTRCRIYAPVGPHKDLLAYLVRRLLENGANSSFVNQLSDVSIDPKKLAADSLSLVKTDYQDSQKTIAKPEKIYANSRKNSKGWDLDNVFDRTSIKAATQPFLRSQWQVEPILVHHSKSTEKISVFNPADLKDCLGSVTFATSEDVVKACSNARSWKQSSIAHRVEVLNKAADLYEQNFGEFFALLRREAGKTTSDAIAELREAVDFLRYYAIECQKLKNRTEKGIFTCISPWNFPLAIFTGQIAAALSVGNGVLAKPAEQTSIIAVIAVKLLHQAGVPKDVLQLLPGRGIDVGHALVSNGGIQGVCFTGSTTTAQSINKAIAESCEPDTTFIAETGGLNAMIVDSTALPEQAIKDIVDSAFQSAGQRCSALRVLYLQEDIADAFLEQLMGAMDQLKIYSPWLLSTDIGPVIDLTSKTKLTAHIETAQSEGRLLKQLSSPAQGHFVGPALISIQGIEDLQEELFGPILHVATFKANNIDTVVDAINRTGFGLTFGLHTRINQRVQSITSKIKAGNIYINRNQIGAVVGCQPFGGEGLSGTGPKAGGPNYLYRFTQATLTEVPENPPMEWPQAPLLSIEQIQQAIYERKKDYIPSVLDTQNQEAPTGETNQLKYYGRGLVLCLGPTLAEALEQEQIAVNTGCVALIVTPFESSDTVLYGSMDFENLQTLEGFDAVAYWGAQETLKKIRQLLSQRKGTILPLITYKEEMKERLLLERNICINTAAFGGDVELLAKI